MERTISSILFRFRLSKRDALALLVSIVVGFAVIAVLSQGVLTKAASYMENDLANASIGNMVVLLVVALAVTRHRLRMVLALLPMFVTMLLIKRAEINMIAFTVVLFLLVVEQRLAHPLAYALLGYLSLKSIPYVDNILLYGDGFLYPPQIIDWALAQFRMSV
jgi:hypothetical protein